MRHFSGQAERLQSLRAVTIWHGIGHVVHSLRCLPDRDRCDDAIRERVDRVETVLVFESDVDSRPIPRRPDSMRQLADRNGRYLREVVGAEDLDFVQSADGDVRE